MSSDNYIRIFEKDLEWHVDELTTEGALMEDLGQWATLEDAVRAANTFMESNEVEYGLKIII